MEKPGAATRMHITMRQLEVFEAVARLGSFTRAAQALHLSQPSVSMQVRQLAESVDQPLFEQIGKRIFLTQIGEELIRTARAMFDAWQAFERFAGDLRDLRTGRLSIACVTTAGAFMPRVVAPFVERHPGVVVRVEVAARDAVVARLAGNADDLCILDVPPAHFDIALHPFLGNPLVAIAAPDHPLVARKRITLARLASENLLLRERGSGTRMAVERLLRDRGVMPEHGTEAGSNEDIVQAVAAGLGVSVVSRLVLPADPSLVGVAVLRVQDLPGDGAWYAAYPGGKKLSPAAAAFLAHLGTVA
jgi:DNA-binding transcriptional LysR family regulator